MLDKTDFEIKTITRDKKSFYNEKDVNLLREHNSSKLLCS